MERISMKRSINYSGIMLTVLADDHKVDLWDDSWAGFTNEFCFAGKDLQEPFV